MPYTDPAEQKAAKKRLNDRAHGKPVRPALGKISFASPRLVIKAIEDAVANVRSDPTLDFLAVARIQLEGARIAALVHAQNIDARIDQLARAVKAVKEENAALRAAAGKVGGLKPLPLALPAAEEKPKRGRPQKVEWEEADLGDRFEARDGKLPLNKGGKPKQKSAVLDLPDVPDAATFATGYEALHEHAHEDEERA